MPGLRILYRCKHTKDRRHLAGIKVFHLFIILLALLWSAGAHAEWYKDYEGGLEMIRKGRYGEAIPRLQSAIREKNQEGINIKFYGMKFDDYLPHYYLGRAHFQLNNFQAALDEMNISANQGQIQKNRNLFQNLTEIKSLATAQLNVNQTPPPPVVIPEKKPDPVQPKPEPVQPKPDPVIPEKKPDTQVAIREPVKVVPPEVKPEPPKPKPEPVPTEDPNLQRAKKMTKDGARRYFQGDFDSAISTFLSALQLTPQDHSAQFLLGCSFANKYLLSGSSDQTSLQKATEAFQKSRKINPNHPLTKSPLISPAVRDIYKNVKS